MQFPKAVVMLLFLSALICPGLKAQMNFAFQEGTFLIKGHITDLQNKAGIPKANIVIMNRRTGYTCDADGAFSIYAYPTDTLRFTSVGYISKIIPVSALNMDSVYSIHIELLRDFVKLKEVTIYPFKTKGEFVQAFMDAKDVNKVTLPGIAPPKFNTKPYKPKFANPVSMIYDKIKRKKSSANPDFRP
jgi:hypothetical protein